LGIALSLAAAGCGYGNGTVIIPHPTGNYSVASFKGSYVFAVHGFFASSGAPYREVGVITADGNGNITAGADELVSSGTGGVISNSSSITGTYNIASDGTGSASLNSTALGAVLSQSQITFAVTLASSSEAELEEADFAADGAGNAELQDSTAISNVPSGTFVFGIHQDVDAQTAASASQVGLMTVSGGSISGNMDENLISSQPSLTLTGTLNAPTAMGAGNGSFTDSSSVTTNFDYFIVNSTKFVVLVSNAGAIGSGTAEAQSGAVASGFAGTYAFGGRGDDVASGTAAIATVGEFTGSGASVSAGTLDSMQDGNYAQAVSFTASAGGTGTNPSPQGRVQVTLSTGPTMVFWMVSPARAYFLTESNAGTQDGTADLQTATSFSASTMKGQYAVVMDGIDSTPQAVARIGTLQFDGSSKTTLVEEVNDSSSGVGAQNPGALAGVYQVGNGGRVATQLSNTGGGLNLVMYAISGSQAYVLQVDSGTNTSGVIKLQK
jgi:hypothetical protein